MSRACNFSAGPAALPEAVLRRAQSEFLEWRDARASVMEISHRGKAFMALAGEIEQRLRRLAAIPEEFAILFMAGGATAQFALAPMNLLHGGGRAAFVLTGNWGEKAWKESQRFAPTDLWASSAETGFDRIPQLDPDRLHPDTTYVHLTSNETIAGVQWHAWPETGGRPLVVDMSSDILSRPVDWGPVGMAYAGAQKNIGPSGLTLVIIRRDWLERCRKALVPMVFNYALQAEQGSMLNTPNTFAWYMVGLVSEWLEEQGGLEAVAERNRDKARRLYRAIDASAFYRNTVQPEHRSWMNVPFRLADDSLDAEFLRRAEAAGLLALKGHRISGGMRASIYNAMEPACVDRLVDFMAAFEAEHGG